ncbi:MAG: Glutamate synthase [NADPH] small chain, partial [uncultured Solirubrobacteraceae bacterium]
AAAARRGRRGALRRRRRRRRVGGGASLRVRRGRAGDRLARAARPAGAGPRPRGRALRDGVPLRAQPLGGRRLVRGADHRRGQERRGHRRRRHRRGLRRERRPRGREADRPARGAPRAARPPSRRPHAVAAVAAEVPPVVRDGGGPRARHGRAGLPRLNDVLRRRGRPGLGAQRRPREPREPVRPAGRGIGLRDQGRPRAARNGLPASGAGAARSARRRARQARQREGLDLRDLRGRRLRRRRRPPGPVADRLGDQRGPPVRPHGRALPRDAGAPGAHPLRQRRAGRHRPRGSAAGPRLVRPVGRV